MGGCCCCCDDDNQEETARLITRANRERSRAQKAERRAKEQEEEAAKQKSRANRERIRANKAERRAQEQEIAAAKHPYKECDGCGEFPIRGMRYKCDNCLDYDLCRECYKRESHFHVGHLFLKIKPDL